MPRATRMDVICYLYSRPTPSQALKEAMKEYLRTDPEVPIGAIMGVAIQEHDTEEKDRSST